jgi:plasmid stabilization system protein ParE
MAGFSVELAAEAAQELATITTWWSKHRLAAPTLFLDELRQVLSKVALSPEMGVIARIPGAGSARVLRLRRSGYMLLYDVDASAKKVIVLRVRHSSRRPLRRVIR